MGSYDPLHRSIFEFFNFVSSEMFLGPPSTRKAVQIVTGSFLNFSCNIQNFAGGFWAFFDGVK